MSQDFGVTETDYTLALWLGDHPPISLDGDLISGQDLVDGTVLGKITASGKLTQFDQDASDGSEDAMGVLMGDLDASGGDEPCIYLAHGQVNSDLLIWPTDLDAGEKVVAVASLLANNIYAK